MRELLALRSKLRLIIENLFIHSPFFQPQQFLPAPTIPQYHISIVPLVKSPGKVYILPGDLIFPYHLPLPQRFIVFRRASWKYIERCGLYHQSGCPDTMWLAGIKMTVSPASNATDDFIFLFPKCPV
ncbi:MAG: hypothetical protein R2825_10755 [Saprospiraceae bacterium]